MVYFSFWKPKKWGGGRIGAVVNPHWAWDIWQDSQKISSRDKQDNLNEKELSRTKVLKYFLY